MHFIQSGENDEKRNGRHINSLQIKTLFISLKNSNSIFRRNPKAPNATDKKGDDADDDEDVSYTDLSHKDPH